MCLIKLNYQERFFSFLITTSKRGGTFFARYVFGLVLGLVLMPMIVDVFIMSYVVSLSSFLCVFLLLLLALAHCSDG